MKKTALVFMALAMAGLSITGCGKTEPKEPEKPATIKVTGVTLDRQTLEITEGETFALTATVAPSNATDKGLTWSSNTTAVATVDGNGKVIAVKAGEATVTVTTKDGGKTATCKVTVKAATVAVTEVELDKATLSLVEGDSETLTATVKPDNATNKEVTWKSNDEKIAAVDETGKVTAVKAGDATVTVTTKDGGKTATSKVTVKEKSIPATGLKVEPSSITFVEGQTKSLKATVTPSNSTDAVVWPGTGTYLTSNGGGSYTAKKLGSNYVGFSLEVKAGSVSAKASVMVYPMWFVDVSDNKVAPDGSAVDIPLNGRKVYYFSKKNSGITTSDYIDKEILPAEDFSVSSSNSSVATVEKTTIGGGEYNGFIIKGIAVGTSTITIKIGSVSRTMTIRVNQK